ncbi:MAG: nuclear transport factor 2 family protein [Pedobacter sp.]
MKNATLFFLIILAQFVGNAKAQRIMEANQSDNNKTQVLAVTRLLTQLMIDRNTVELNKILAPDFTLTHMTGYVQSKKEWFSEIANERMKYYSYKEVKTSVEIKGEKATFIGQNVLDARIWGSRNKWRLQQVMQLENRNGKWIFLNSIATTF